MTTRALLAALLAAAAPAFAAGADAAQAYLKPPPPAAVPGGCKLSPAGGGLVRLPLLAPESRPCPVARAGASAVTVQDLVEVLAQAHQPRGAPAGEKRPDMDFAPALERLVESRLLAAEAKEMGLEDLPEVKAAVEEARAGVRRRLVQRLATRGLRPEALEVERLYRQAVQEWKVRSLLFDRAEDAAAFQAAAAGGKPFDELARAELAAKRARGGEQEWIAARQALPQIREALAGLSVGGVSRPVAVPRGQAVMRLDEVRFPDDPAAREEAEQVSLERQRRAAEEAQLAALKRKYASVDEKLVAGLDWEAEKPGHQALAKDRRVAAAIRGGKPITVAELTARIAKKFFHGLEGPVREKRVNVEKKGALDALLSERLYAREAAARGIEASADFRRALGEQRRALAFGAFVERVIVPGVRVEEAEGRRYFEEHKAEFTTPQMFRLEGLGFSSSKAAQAALDRLRGGTDLAWLRANADGQLRPGERSMSFDGSVVSANNLPPDLAKVLTGAGAGSLRLYARNGQHYAVRVADETPPRVQSYEQARESIGKKLFAEKVAKAIHDYADKVRKVRPVEVYITRIEG